ncbi:hypothetical protein HMPREF9413_5889 [Paenibacillus sp. HGF7]|nr:hypothetical protein HMPREF9413_5889 [Paenibacillus sp. HGF7]
MLFRVEEEKPAGPVRADGAKRRSTGLQSTAGIVRVGVLREQVG